LASATETNAMISDVPPPAPDHAPAVPTSHPTGFWFIFTGELAERASFYGMRAILVLYLVDVFKFSQENANSIYAFYLAACYFTPLIGGFIADRILNKYWTIVAFAVPYVIGQFIVGLSKEYLMFGALGLLAFGSGVIKPNISTLMGLTYDEKRPGQEDLRNFAFTLFYVAINVGAALSSLICPELRNYVGVVINPETNKLAHPEAGYFAAFLFPAVLMTCALTFFALGKRYYAHEELGFRKDPTRPVEPTETSAEKFKVVKQLLGLFIPVIFFWAIFDQHGSTWTLFARDYLDRTIEVFGFSKTFAPDGIQAVNPILIVVFAPLMSVMFARLAKGGFRVRATDKMILGFVLTASAMAIHAYAGYLAVGAGGQINKVTVWWQILAYFIITMAEILISITGLELAFAAAPKSMKGFITSLWLLMVGLANLFINAPVTRLYPGDGAGWHFDNPTQYFGMLSVAMLVVAGVFLFVARNFNKSRAAI
jgi:dipeptide/tripeptide permease